MAACNVTLAITITLIAQSFLHAEVDIFSIREIKFRRDLVKIVTIFNVSVYTKTIQVSFTSLQ